MTKQNNTTVHSQDMTLDDATLSILISGQQGDKPHLQIKEPDGGVEAQAVNQQLGTYE